ncbi:Probable flavin-containing monooxygenase 1 [Linum perenne]
MAGIKSSKVGIIGGGVSGLAALKQLARYEPVLFEASNCLGGIWKSCSYSSTKLQTPRKNYEFSDFPWPNRDDPTPPSYLKILEYLRSYAEHFDLLKYVQFNAKVVEVNYLNDGDQSQTNSFTEYGDLLPGRPAVFNLNSFHRPSFASRFNSNSSVSVPLPFTRSKPRRVQYMHMVLQILHSSSSAVDWYCENDIEKEMAEVKNAARLEAEQQKRRLDEMENNMVNMQAQMQSFINAQMQAFMNTNKWHEFKLLVVCTGKYGDIPNIPQFPTGRGPETFKGKVMHVIDYCKLDKQEATRLMKGKKVAIVGFKKSAIDLTLECAEANEGPEGKPCTMIIRTLHWTVPDYLVWGLPLFYFLSTRSSQFFNPRPDQGLLRTLLCLLSTPLRRAISMFIESYILHKLPLKKYGLKPEHPFLEDFASCMMGILPHEFFKKVENGKIMFKRASNWSFCHDGLMFDDNTILEADIVIFATGYSGKKKLTNIIPEPFRAKLEDPFSGLMLLYRGTINPFIPNMAFVGYIESSANLHIAELRSKWLAQLADNNFKLPTVQKMNEDVLKEIKIMKECSRFYQRHCISSYSINHNDVICQDMGWTSWRKKTYIAEALSPYQGEDYKED